jgi:hypothetical protein
MASQIASAAPSTLEKNRSRDLQHGREHSVDRHVEMEPKRHSWMIIAAGAVVPVALSIAATVTACYSESERVGIAAWVAVAVAGTGSAIATAAASRRRTVATERDDGRHLVTSSGQAIARA